MDNIWDENPSKLEVIGRCGGMSKLYDHAEPTKVELKKLTQHNYQHIQYNDFTVFTYCS